MSEKILFVEDEPSLQKAIKELLTQEGFKIFTADIPVIVLTNLEGMGDVEKALELGATTYLVKANYELEDVLKTVREHLKK